MEKGFPKRQHNEADTADLLPLTPAEWLGPQQQSFTGQWIDNWQWTTEDWDAWNAEIVL